MPRSGLQRPLVFVQPALKSDLCGGHQRPLQIFGPLSEGWPHPRNCINAQIWSLEAASSRATKGVINEASPLSRLILCCLGKKTLEKFLANFIYYVSKVILRVIKLKSARQKQQLTSCFAQYYNSKMIYLICQDCKNNSDSNVPSLKKQ